MNHDEQPRSVDAVEEHLSAKGKDEMNLAEFPIAKIGRNDKKSTIEYEGWIVDKEGNRQQQKWVVSSSAAVGLPTEFAERVLVALMAFTAQEQFASKKVTFSVYRILKTLGLSMNKRNYKAVEKALKQLVGVTIYSEGAFWDKQKQKRVNRLKGFHLIDDIWLKYLEDDDSVIEEEGANGYIVWGNQLWSSFKAGYIKNLDIEFYYGLNSAIARRLYRFLDKRMHYQDEYQIDVFDLASRLGMARYAKPTHVRRKLKPGFDELIECGYLDAVETVKVGKYTRFRFAKGHTRLVQGVLWDVSESSLGGLEEALGDETADEPFMGQNEPWSAFYEAYGTTQAHHDTWAAVLKSLSMSMPQPTYQQYLEDTQLLSIEGEVAIIGVLHATSKDWLENRMGNKILKALNGQLEEKVQSIQFVSLKELSSA